MKNVIYPPETPLALIMKKVVYPTEQPSFSTNKKVVFLAGSIEMGKAIDWQTRVINSISDEANVILMNPRRKDWDSSWEQSPDFAPFREQVEWELNGIQNADIVLFYFQDGTMSPISLLELGLVLNRSDERKVVVCCPKKFWRWGNVVITSQTKNVPVYETLEEAISELRNSL